mmetsp:Transcript_150473/g.483673  ORF Transcript_150473/g.483673 Transcript_150473/m.483673 type:complete len:229 (+) Transcript_150473:1231-1917(+)
MSSEPCIPACSSMERRSAPLFVQQQSSSTPPPRPHKGPPQQQRNERAPARAMQLQPPGCEHGKDRQQARASRWGRMMEVPSYTAFPTALSTQPYMPLANEDSRTKSRNSPSPHCSLTSESRVSSGFWRKPTRRSPNTTSDGTRSTSTNNSMSTSAIMLMARSVAPNQRNAVPTVTSLAPLPALSAGRDTRQPTAKTNTCHASWDTKMKTTVPSEKRSGNIQAKASGKS